MSKGFEYDQLNEFWRKNLGFGRMIIVDHIVKGIFKITKNDEVVFDNYIDSFEEFKEIVDKTLA